MIPNSAASASRRLSVSPHNGNRQIIEADICGYPARCIVREKRGEEAGICIAAEALRAPGTVLLVVE